MVGCRQEGGGSLTHALFHSVITGVKSVRVNAPFACWHMYAFVPKGININIYTVTDINTCKMFHMIKIKISAEIITCIRIKGVDWLYAGALI